MSNALATIERALSPLAPQFDQLLRPIGVPAERIIRSVLISCERTPKLLECTPLSIIQGAGTLAVLGLEADGFTGQAWLVPFRDHGIYKAQPLVGFKGYNTLAARVGLTVDGEVVREGDSFEFELGTAAFVRHKKQLGAGTDRRIIGAWAAATAPGRNPIVVVLDIDEILAVKARSQAAKSRGGDEAFSPWNDPAVGFPAMSGKTAKRRLARSLPLSVYINAARVDEAHEEQGAHAWIHPEKGLVIDGVGQPLADPQPAPVAPQALAKPPSFRVTRLDGTTYDCNTIEEWRGKMQMAVRSIARHERIERFRDLNAPRMDDYAEKYAGDVRAVSYEIERRLKEI